MAQAYERPGEKLTLLAAADHTTKRYHAVVVNSSGQAALAGANKVIAGVIREGQDIGRAEEITASGITFAVFGAAVTAGASVTTNASGRFITATTGQTVSGIAMVGGSADGDIGCVLLKEGVI